MARFRRWLGAALAGLGLIVSIPSAAVEITGYISADPQFFPQSPLHAEQFETASLSLSTEFEVYHDWANGDQSVLFTPFFRFDQRDGERTHFDIRELFWLKVADTWELRVGLQKVYWGVTESQHLVDVLNQTDLVEGIDGEDKLGQPMANFTWIQDFGVFDLYLMTGFRERTFPGVEGRLRAPLAVDRDLTTYESNAEEFHVDWAARWAHTLGAFDLGVSHFYGTSRDPILNVVSSMNGGPALAPHYPLIDQTGLDVQAVVGGWLLKAEAINRRGYGDRYAAGVGGFEYTFGDVWHTGADVGVLAEYHLDERGGDATTPFNDDLFVGVRLALNDVQSTALLAGFAVDRESGAASGLIEASRRIGEAWTLDVQANGVTGTEDGDLLHAFRQDAVIRLDLARHF